MRHIITYIFSSWTSFVILEIFPWSPLSQALRNISLVPDLPIFLFCQTNIQLKRGSKFPVLVIFYLRKHLYITHEKSIVCTNLFLYYKKSYGPALIKNGMVVLLVLKIIPTPDDSLEPPCLYFHFSNTYLDPEILWQERKRHKKVRCSREIFDPLSKCPM